VRHKGNRIASCKMANKSSYQVHENQLAGSARPDGRVKGVHHPRKQTTPVGKELVLVTEWGWGEDNPPP